MLTKEECEKVYTDLEISRTILKEAIERNGELINPVGIFDKALVTFARLISERFDNPPITVSDIPYEKELICWDNAEKEWRSIYSEGGEVSIAYFQLPTVYTMYETFDKKHGNRFYRKEVQE